MNENGEIIGNRLWCLSWKWWSLLCFCMAFVWIKYWTVALFHLVHRCGFIGVRISLLFPQTDLKSNIYTSQQSHKVWRPAGVIKLCSDVGLSPMTRPLLWSRAELWWLPTRLGVWVKKQIQETDGKAQPRCPDPRHSFCTPGPPEGRSVRTGAFTRSLPLTQERLDQISEADQ